MFGMLDIFATRNGILGSPLLTLISPERRAAETVAAGAARHPYRLGGQQTFKSTGEGGGFGSST